MHAAYYESVGPASAVIRIGERPTPQPGPGAVRIRIHTSGVNPSEHQRACSLIHQALEDGILKHSIGARHGLKVVNVQ